MLLYRQSNIYMPPTDDAPPKRGFQLFLPVELHKALKIRASELGTSMTALIVKGAKIVLAMKEATASK